MAIGSKVSEVGYVPYGWQYADEDVCLAAQKGKSLNIFGMISRANDFIYGTSQDNIDTDFVITFFDTFSFSLAKSTVVVLDNASVHTSQKFKERLACWQERGLYVFYLPPYSPHLNIVERVWKELKARWLQPADYKTADSLFYAVKLALNAVGNDLNINFSKYDFGLN